MLFRSEYGQISLNVDVQSNIMVGTRASSAAELGDYLVAIYQGDEVKLSTTKYSELPLYLYYPAGAGYTIYVGNCTEDEALSANDNWGQLRIAGTSPSFAVMAGKNTLVSFGCTVQNAVVGVNYQDSFKEKFTDYSVSVCETSDANRTLIFPNNATFESHAAYFNIDSNPQISYEIKGKLNGVERTATGIISIAKAKYYKLNIKSNSTGDITLSVTIDSSVDEESEDVTVNPYVR